MRDLRELNYLRRRDFEMQLGMPPEMRQWGGVFAYASRKTARSMRIIATAGDAPGAETGWDHVSVSHSNRCPTWDEMCEIRSLFFHPHEWAMQLHPPESDNISNHPFCLHIWRPLHADIPLPPSILVGIKDLGDLSAKGLKP